MELKLLKSIEVGRNGGESLHFCDIDDDNEKELIFRQSAGIMAQESYRSADGLDPENFDLLCYTCLKQNGNIIWQYGKPWSKQEPYRNHGEIRLTLIEDINNDGKPELLYKYHDWLIQRDIKTGKLIKELKLPNDDGWKIVLQNMGDEPPNIMILGEHQMFVYSTDLKLLSEKHGGEYHAFSLVDIDGDNKDELFLGDCLYDHDGRLIWKWEHLSHIDYVEARDINQDGIYEVMYCVCHGDFVIFDVNGNELFRDSSFIHPQAFLTGKFMPEVFGYQIFVMNKASHGGSVMLDCEGRKLWEYPCNGYCMTIPGESGQPDMILHRPSPGRMSLELQTEYLNKAKQLGYEDLPIEIGKPSEPILLDGHGKIIFRFPVLEELDGIKEKPLKNVNSGDFGYVYSTMIDDVNGDGRNEWIAYKRHKVWIFDIS